MATTTAPTRRTRFSRRIPDHVTDELVQVLQIPRVFEFNDLFGLVYENLKKRNAVSGGEEMLRLRAYEKLQNLVGRGFVEKVGRTYRGLEGIKTAIVPMPPKPMIPSATARAAAAAAAEEEAAPTNRLVATPVKVEAPKKEEPKAKVVAKPTVVKTPVKAKAPVKAAASKPTAKAASAKAKPAKAKVAAKAPAKRSAAPVKAKKK